jgi:hypothetical protein
MNRLEYRSNADDYLAFELIVDGEPLAKLVGATDSWIPHWLFKSGLPRVGPGRPNTYIVGVCSCGEWGCGSTTCQVDLVDDTATFHHFDDDASADGSARSYTFSRANYDEVMRAISIEIDAHSGAQG